MQIQGASGAGRGGAYPGIRDRMTQRAGFADAMSEAGEVRQEEYLEHLRSKYGAHFRVESVPNDPESLDRIAKTMHGDDVIIAPNVVREMAQDPDVAAWYERTIDHCFETVPQDKANFAAMGLTFEPCGVVVHEDGTVTYICGGGDTPERVAQVNAINAARDARRAERRHAIVQAQIEHAAASRQLDARRAAAQASVLKLRLRAAAPASETAWALPEMD